MCSVKALLFCALVAGVFCLAVDALRTNSFGQAAYEPDYYPNYYPQQQLLQVKKKPLRDHEKPQDFNKIPGTPGVDYPLYHSVPHTNFHCSDVPVHPGMYANVETGCQAYHTCHDGREGDQGASFLCANGTLFNQEIFSCDWWYNVDCAHAPSLYNLNADPEKNPFAPKPKKLEEEELKKPVFNNFY